MHILTSKRIAIPISFLALLGATVFGLSRNTRSQQLQSSPSTDERLHQIENSEDQPLRIIENDDSPLRILHAKVKEISGPDFTKLTGQRTDLPTVCSVPEVRLLNSSAKAITGFILVVRDPTSKRSRGIVQSNVEIRQGETYMFPRSFFVRSEMVSRVEKDGSIQAGRVRPEMNSPQYWLSFAGRTDLFVTVARVNFRDGSSWEVKEGGDLK